MAEPERTYREVAFEDWIAQGEDFSAHDDCRLKVTRGAEVIAVTLRVTSVPQDIITAWQRRRPRPPVRPVTDKATRQTSLVPDEQDPKYLEALDAYNLQMTREIVGRGIAQPLTLLDGRAATTPDERFQALEARGLSGQHFVALTQAILGLTEWSEAERERHL